MKLIEPNKDYLESYYRACIETWGYVHDNYIIHNPDEYLIWKDNIFKDFENNEKGINLPDGFVPNVTYWLVQEDEYLGTANIRLKLSESLKEYGGTFGIFLRQSARGKSLGVKFVQLVLEKLKELNITPVVVTCEESNTASWHTIERLNYQKKELYITNLNNKLTQARRYWL